jgi:hypothetical protein
MEEQVLPSQAPMQSPPEPQITPEQLAELKAIARQRAIQQTLEQRAAAPELQQQQPQVVYVRRNLTVAELLLVILLSCGIVTGIQVTWNTVSNLLPRIEVKVR